MKRGSLITVALVIATVGLGAGQEKSETAGVFQGGIGQPTFKAGVDLVRVAAVVRDHKGRFVQDLTARDFEVLEGGTRRPITDFRRDTSGVSVALLFDVSGSMEGHLGYAREAATHVLSWLDARDEVAIYTFDTRLREVTPFTNQLRALP